MVLSALSQVYATPDQTFKITPYDMIKSRAGEKVEIEIIDGNIFFKHCKANFTSCFYINHEVVGVDQFVNYLEEAKSKFWWSLAAETGTATALTIGSFFTKSKWIKYVSRTVGVVYVAGEVATVPERYSIYNSYQLLKKLLAFKNFKVESIQETVLDIMEICEEIYEENSVSIPIWEVLPGYVDVYFE